MKKKIEKVDFDVSGLRNIDSFPLLGGLKNASRLRFPLVGQVVLITSINREKVTSLTPQSWISIFSSRPAIVGFGCNLSQHRITALTKIRRSHQQINAAVIVELNRGTPPVNTGNA